jgi:putative phosphonate catabolism associated alcohol dehydrogenase
MTIMAAAAVFHGAERAIEIREIPVPAPRGPEVLVEVLACTICASDLHSLEGRRRVPVPTILGHEILGNIAEFGPTAARHDRAGQPLSVGDRVTWGVIASCGDCFYCRRSLTQKCERQLKYGHEPLRPGRELTGGLATHCVLVAGTDMLLVPQELSDAAACPANCAGATVAAALERAGALAGRSVLILGGGMLGVTTTAWACMLGAEHVIVCDIAPERQRLATKFGATHTAAPDAIADMTRNCTDGHGVDVVFEMTGTPDAFEVALSLSRMGGSIVLVGSVFPSRAVPVAAEQLVRRCLTVNGIHNYNSGHLRSALCFLAAHPSLPFTDLVSPWEPLAAFPRAVATPLPAGKLRLGIRPCSEA